MVLGPASASTSGSHYQLRRLSVSSSSGDGHTGGSIGQPGHGGRDGIGSNLITTTSTVSPIYGLGTMLNNSTTRLLGLDTSPKPAQAHYGLRRLSRDANADTGGSGSEMEELERRRAGTGWAHHADTQFTLGLPAFPVASGSGSGSNSNSGSGGYNSTGGATNGSDSDPKSGVSTPTRPVHQYADGQDQNHVHVQGRPNRSNSAATPTGSSTTGRTRPVISPLIIPDQPVFSSYPVISGRTSSLTTDEDELDMDTPTRWKASPIARSVDTGGSRTKGRRRVSMSAGVAGYSISERGHGQGQGHPMATSRYKRRSPSLHVLPTDIHRSNAVGENPLAHTWGRKTFVEGTQMEPLASSSSTSYRKRRATMSAGPHDFVFGTLGNDLEQGQLPPGAMPAMDPARQSEFFQRSPVDGRQRAWVEREPPPKRIMPPRRTSSLEIKDRPGKTDLTWYTPDHKKTEKSTKQPFIYVPASDVNFTLHAIPGGVMGQGRPLVSPALSNKSHASRSGVDFFSSRPIAGTSILGLDEEGLSTLTLRAERPSGSSVTHFKEEYQVAPPESGSKEHAVGTSYDEDHDQIPSLTGTSSGAGTAEVMLSSASTSLSRSTKNAKDGNDKQEPVIANSNDPAVDMNGLTKALQDRLAIRVARSDRRKYQLVELVETEVAYTSHLRDLVEIFLPQLAALSCITESDHKLISRNLGDMLYFHEQFSARMVEVLKEEHLGTEADLPTPVDEPARTERMIRKVSAVFIEDVSTRSEYQHPLFV